MSQTATPTVYGPYSTYQYDPNPVQQAPAQVYPAYQQAPAPVDPAPASLDSVPQGFSPEELQRFIEECARVAPAADHLPPPSPPLVASNEPINTVSQQYNIATYGLPFPFGGLIDAAKRGELDAAYSAGAAIPGIDAIRTIYYRRGEGPLTGRQYAPQNVPAALGPAFHLASYKDHTDERTKATGEWFKWTVDRSVTVSTDLRSIAVAVLFFGGSAYVSPGRSVVQKPLSELLICHCALS